MKIKVKFEFTNKKGQKKKVNFLIDRKTYEMLKNVNKEERDSYMLEEYRWYCSEQKYRRRVMRMEWIEKDKEEKVKTKEADIVDEMLEGLSEDERNIIKLLYYDSLTQEEVAKLYKCSRQKITYIHNKILKKLKEKYKK